MDVGGFGNIARTAQKYCTHYALSLSLGNIARTTHSLSEILHTLCALCLKYCTHYILSLSLSSLHICASLVFGLSLSLPLSLSLSRSLFLFFSLSCENYKPLRRGVVCVSVCARARRGPATAETPTRTSPLPPSPQSPSAVSRGTARSSSPAATRSRSPPPPPPPRHRTAPAAPAASSRAPPPSEIMSPPPARSPARPPRHPAAPKPARRTAAPPPHAPAPPRPGGVPRRRLILTVLIAPASAGGAAAARGGLKDSSSPDRSPPLPIYPLPLLEMPSALSSVRVQKDSRLDPPPCWGVGGGRSCGVYRTAWPSLAGWLGELSNWLNDSRVADARGRKRSVSHSIAKSP